LSGATSYSKIWEPGRNISVFEHYNFKIIRKVGEDDGFQKGGMAEIWLVSETHLNKLMVVT
jgi:hypothetical protein